MSNFRIVKDGREGFLEFTGTIPATVDGLFDLAIEKWTVLSESSEHPIMDGGANTCVFCLSARPAILTCSGCPIALAHHRSCQDTPYIAYVDLTDYGAEEALKRVTEMYGLAEDISANEALAIVAGLEAEFIDSLRDTESIRSEMAEYLAIKNKMEAYKKRLAQLGWKYLASIHMSKGMYRRNWQCWMNWQTGDISFRQRKGAYHE